MMHEYEEYLASEAREIRRYRIVLIVMWVACLFAMCAFVFEMQAEAHEATNVQGQPLGIPYPISCCSLQDCRPTLDGEVRETPKGYTLVSTGEFVPHGDKRIRPFAADGKIHVCQVAGNFKSGRILCLLVPPPSF